MNDAFYDTMEEVIILNLVYRIKPSTNKLANLFIIEFFNMVTITYQSRIKTALLSFSSPVMI